MSLKNALIIDDDTSILRNLSRLLRENEYEVWAVTTSNEAITEVNKRSFDLLLIDFVLPDMDGLTFLETIAAKVSDAVKIMITGFPTLRETMRALDLGIDSYIEKPINFHALIELIERKTAEKQKKRTDKQNNSASPFPLT
jgi:DNA-binding NtrC family response regulator